jgi:hypothetical protein
MGSRSGKRASAASATRHAQGFMSRRR